VLIVYVDTIIDIIWVIFVYNMHNIVMFVITAIKYYHRIHVWLS